MWNLPAVIFIDRFILKNFRLITLSESNDNTPVFLSSTQIMQKYPQI